MVNIQRTSRDEYVFISLADNNAPKALYGKKINCGSAPINAIAQIQPPQYKCFIQTDVIKSLSFMQSTIRSKQNRIAQNLIRLVAQVLFQ